MCHLVVKTPRTPPAVLEPRQSGSTDKKDWPFHRVIMRGSQSIACSRAGNGPCTPLISAASPFIAGQFIRPGHSLVLGLSVDRLESPSRSNVDHNIIFCIFSIPWAAYSTYSGASHDIGIIDIFQNRAASSGRARQRQPRPCHRSKARQPKR